MITDQDNRKQLTGISTVGPHALNMDVKKSNWVKVYKLVGDVETLLVENSAYTISAGSSATITFTSAPSSSATYTVVKSVPKTQEDDYTDRVPFFMDSLEASLDKLTEMVQATDEEISRTVQLVPGVTSASIETFVDAPVEDGYLLWNSDATKLTGLADLTNLDTVLSDPVPTSQGGFNGATQDNAKTVLELQTTDSPAFGGISAASVTLNDSDNSNSVKLQAPTTIDTNYTLTLPDSDGTNGQILSRGASGVVTWEDNPVGTVSSVVAGSGISGGTITTTGTLDLNINGLTEATTIASADEILYYDASATIEKNIEYSNFRHNINGLTEKTSPDGSADFLPVYDTAGAAVKKALINNRPVDINSLTTSSSPDPGADFVLLQKADNSFKKVTPENLQLPQLAGKPNLLVCPNAYGKYFATASTAVGSTPSSPHNLHVPGLTSAVATSNGFGWRYFHSGTTASMIRSATMTGATTPYPGCPEQYWRFVTGAVAKVGLFQVIPNLKVLNLRGRPISVSCYAKHSTNDVGFTIGVAYWTGTADNTTSDPISAFGATNVLPTLAAGWTWIDTPTTFTTTTSFERYQVNNLTVPTTANNIAVFVFKNKTDNLEAHFVGLNVTEGASSQKAFYDPILETKKGTARGQYFNSSLTTGFNLVAAGYAQSSTAFKVYIPFPALMLPKVGGVVDYNLYITAANCRLRHKTTETACSTVVVSKVYTQGVLLTGTVASGLTAGDSVILSAASGGGNALTSGAYVLL